MFIVILKLIDRSKAGPLMQAHNEWISRGFADGVFVLVGSLQPNLGGALLARNTSRPALQARLQEDPFVAASVVSAEIFEISPARFDERLQLLAE
jgi:uncharacterized protein YciI